MDRERLERQFDFIKEIDKEKFIQRQTKLSDGVRRENDAEHAWHMAIMTVLLSEYANEKIDVLRTVTMLLIHDIVEIDAEMCIRDSQKDRRNTLVEITKSGQEVLDESNEITNEFIRRVFEKTDKEEMARLVSYIHQQYDLAKEELEKIRQSQKKAADKHTGANHSANVRFTDS